MLIDPGSELSFISEELVKLIGLKRTNANIPLIGIGGRFSGRTKGVVNVSIHSIHDISVSHHLKAYILPTLTFELPSFTVDSNSWNHLRGLALADPDFGKPKPIHLILGADSYGSIIKPDLLQEDPSLPLAQKTIFGWIISGPVTHMTTNSDICSYHCSVDQNLLDLLTKFWTQEELAPTKTNILHPDDEKCESHFRSTFSRNETGRYIVRLPLKSSSFSLGDSSAKALQCLSRLTRRFERDPSYRQLYVDFLREYILLGHMTPVTDTENHRSPSFYLPHHGVLRKHSETTKLRVVFNGSSQSDNGTSLNDILHSGAKLQTDIADVLLWFRKHRFVFSTDIEKMYRQILIHEDDRHLQQIYWYDEKQNPIPYHLTTVTYGLNCVPFLALRVIQQLIEDEGDQYPDAIPSLSKGRYVDDIFGGADTIQDTIRIVKQLERLCMAGGFPLQKWNSNYQEILKPLSIQSNEKASMVELETSRIKVLGLSWQPDHDTFNFICTPSAHRNITKRSILSEIAQIYDPLGLLSPVIIRAKIYIQELWLIKMDWDETLKPDLQHRWNKFRQQLLSLNNISIPRWLHLSSSTNIIELHGFSDASTLAMSAVIYIRVVSRTDNVNINLVCAKTKVAPLKSMTIPRLELTAAVMLSRLTAKVQRTLELSESSIFLWTDSAVTLTWISSHPSKWKDFIRNRTTIIQELNPNAVWKFVLGKENPADCASRGIDVDSLEQHPLWWRGPPWLKQTPDCWPNHQPSLSSKTNLEERPQRVMTTMRDSRSLPWDLLERYSSLTRLVRITALCKRAIARFRHHNSDPLDIPLSTSELALSIQFWIRHVQNCYFHQDIEILTKGDPLPKSNPLIRLTPFVDENGLLRVGGRLRHTMLDPDFKNPFILPKQSLLTILVIADAHSKTLHGGTQVTLARIRQSYWIIGGRTPVRSYILRCIRCARYRRNRAQQLMGQLPAARVTPSRPFLHTGVDYAGPISLKTWRGRASRIYKGYLSIFTCFSTSAIHIEIVTDYSTEAFLAAYKRFTGRRGICATLNSDCGTNFIGADAELKRLFNAASKEMKELATLLANDGTEWRFIPPAAPHFGGKWEAAVKSTKFHLRRIIGDSALTYEELSTLLNQIEAILNSRPLCPLSEDSDDYTALTPGHFLIGEPLTLIPEPRVIDIPTSRLTRWQLIRQKVELFWKRWTAECLQRYQAISKWHHSSNEVKVGSLVLLVDERYPPTKWPLARVEHLHPGNDGLTRVVTLRTSTTSLKRPITKICVLLPDPALNTFGNAVPEGGRNVALT